MEWSNINYKQMRNKNNSKYKSMKVKSKPKNNKSFEYPQTTGQ